MHPRYLKLAVAIAAVSLTAAACGDDDETSASDTTAAQEAAASPMEDHGAASTDSPASDLRAGLTSLLQEHVYLAGIAINQAVADGGDLEAPATAAAVGTLDANSVALSDAVASVYGEEAGAQFLELWRAHIGFFVDYTLGGATGDTAMQDQAKAQLDDYRADFGAFVESATEGNLAADAVAENLQVHVDTLVAAVDAVLAGDPAVFERLREAAQHMPSTADALAAAIVAANPDQFAA